MLKLTAVISALLVYSAPASRPSPLEQHNSKTTIIRIENFGFQPSVLTLPVGATVEWKNVDIVPHTATAVDKKIFDSGRIPTGGSWRVTLEKSGTFEYECTLHPNMKGKLVFR